MKKLITCVFALCIVLNLNAQQQNQPTIEDGLYRVVMLDTTEADKTKLKKGEQEIFFSQLFNEFNLEGYLRLVVDAADYVPLSLSKKPHTVKASSSKKDLLLSLNNKSTVKLAEFTKKHFGEHVAIIVNGEALTMHVIKAIINDGQLKISRCNDNACEQLLIQLKNNVDADK